MLEHRKMPVGAELTPEGGASFRVWAPRSQRVAVEFTSESGSETLVPLTAEGGGYFSGQIPAARAGDRYKFKTERGAFPDPVSRSQPDGPHGRSQIVDPTSFAWTDQAWRGRPKSELVIYELHLGTFTPEGTWKAAQERLADLAALGVTMVEIMPIAEFPGDYGWGYDGVGFFAPAKLYGTPDDARAFVNRAHELGVAVILDVVYNHFGPDGNYLREFSPDYFSSKYANEWGDPLNFDGANSGPVREFFTANARYWIEEFHFDGLRLDATQQIFDESEIHVLTEVAAAARAAGQGREIFIVAENEAQEARLVRPPERGGCGLDAIWNDDFHHVARVAATGRAEAYYSGYRGTAQELVSAVKHGFLYQGQWYLWQKKRRGKNAFDLPPHSFVTFLENHDQVANSLRGLRLHQLTSPGKLRALTALLLLGPNIPMLFQGQEFAASSPFLFFSHHHDELQRAVSDGRRRFLRQFPSVVSVESGGIMSEPGERRTYERSKLDWSERADGWHAAVLRLHTDLLRLRREDPVLRAPAKVDGAILNERAFVLRFFASNGEDRLLLVNLGSDFCLGAAAEPLLAPIDEHGWRAVWSSEVPEYGGTGMAPVETRGGWVLAGETAVLLAPNDNHDLPDVRISEKD